MYVSSLVGRRSAGLRRLRAVGIGLTAALVAAGLIVPSAHAEDSTEAPAAVETLIDTPAEEVPVLADEAAPITEVVVPVEEAAPAVTTPLPPTEEVISITPEVLVEPVITPEAAPAAEEVTTQANETEEWTVHSFAFLFDRHPDNWAGPQLLVDYSKGRYSWSIDQLTALAQQYCAEVDLDGNGVVSYQTDKVSIFEIAFGNLIGTWTTVRAEGGVLEFGPWEPDGADWTRRGTVLCSVPAPDPIIVPLTDTRTSCEAGLETRNGLSTTSFIRETGWNWIPGEPVVTWEEWAYTRDLTVSEQLELRCIDPITPVPPVFHLADECEVRSFVDIPSQEGVQYLINGSPVEAGLQAISGKTVVAALASGEVPLVWADWVWFATASFTECPPPPVDPPGPTTPPVDSPTTPPVVPIDNPTPPAAPAPSAPAPSTASPTPTVTVTVSATPVATHTVVATATLPETGASSNGLVALAAVLLLIGGAALLVNRRQRQL